MGAEVGEEIAEDWLVSGWMVSVWEKIVGARTMTAVAAEAADNAEQ